MIEQGKLGELFDIDFDAGRMFWKRPPKYHPRLLGTEAGGPRPAHAKVYWVIKIGALAHKRGRLIFLAANGRWPSPCVDHINGNSLDDRLANLREASIAENARNHKTRAKKSILPMGVRMTGSGRFQARIGIDRGQISLGIFDTVDEAHAVYISKRKELFHEFA